jgi:cyanophycinase
MSKGILSFIMPGLLLLSGVCSQSQSQINAISDNIFGSLLISGGALASTNAEVYNKFIELAGGKDYAKIGIIPAASISLRNSENFKKDLMDYGVPARNIYTIPISVTESKWINNAEDCEVVQQIKACTGIWFVGGDQCRITEALYRKNGENTLALDAIWEIYRNGKVIGGTSAGAAIMSNIMIGYGDSIGAINEGVTEAYTKPEEKEFDRVYITKGLGFFHYGIVDQHFDSRARLGRLIAAAYEKGNKSLYAYGIDENTALVINNVNKTLEVIGEGGVTIVDVSKARKNYGNARMCMTDIYISYIVKGDLLHLDSKRIKMGKPVIPKGKEYWEYSTSPVTGVLSANSRLKDFLCHDLIDNYKNEEVVSYCFDSKGKGAELVFRKCAATKGYWNYKNGNTDDYSFLNVALDIRPINLTIHGAAEEKE